MSVNLYITRHGQTLWNTEKRMQGWKDSPLTEKGISQAELLRKRLEDIPIDLIYSSPLGRAFKTAIIAKGNKKIPIIQDDRLKEINMGVWQGKNESEITEEYSEEYNNFWKKPNIYKPYCGETFKDVSKRAMSFVKDILSKYNDKNILIVTHTITLKSIMAHYENRSLEKFWEPPFVHPTSLSLVRINNEDFEIIMNADTSHLKEIEEIRAV